MLHDAVREEGEEEKPETPRGGVEIPEALQGAREGRDGYLLGRGQVPRHARGVGERLGREPPDELRQRPLVAAPDQGDDLLIGLLLLHREPV